MIKQGDDLDEWFFVGVNGFYAADCFRNQLPGTIKLHFTFIGALQLTYAAYVRGCAGQGAPIAPDPGHAHAALIIAQPAGANLADDLVHLVNKFWRDKDLNFYHWKFHSTTPFPV